MSSAHAVEPCKARLSVEYAVCKKVNLGTRLSPVLFGSESVFDRGESARPQ